MSNASAVESTAVRRSSKRSTMFFVRALVASGLLIVLFLGVDWYALAQQLFTADIRWFFVAVGVYLCSQVLSSVRWGGLGRAVGIQESAGRYLTIYLQGAFFGLCLPSSIGGDVIKAYRIAGTAAERVLAGCTVLVDRLSGLTAVGIFGCLGVMLCAGWGLAITLLACSGLWCLAAMGVCWIGKVPLPWGALIRSFPAGLRKLCERLTPYAKRPWVLVRAALWSLPVQLLNISTVILLGRALGLPLEPMTYFVAVPVTALVATLPLSLAGMGLREGGIVAVLAWYGYTGEGALALGILWTAAIYLAGLVGGIVFLWDFSAPSLQELAEDSQPPVAVTSSTS